MYIQYLWDVVFNIFIKPSLLIIDNSQILYILIFLLDLSKIERSMLKYPLW